MKLVMKLAPVFAAILLVGCGSGGSGSSATSWQTVTADDNSYSVSMPGKPTTQTQSVDVPQGKIEVKMQDLSTVGVDYTVGYSQYPDGFLATVGPDATAMFIKARDATVKQRQAKIVEDTEGTVAGFPSRTEVMTFHMAENSDDVTMKQVMILAKGRMFIVQTIVLSKAPPQATADGAKFHSSFTLNVK